MFSKYLKTNLFLQVAVEGQAGAGFGAGQAQEHAPRRPLALPRDRLVRAPRHLYTPGRQVSKASRPAGATRGPSRDVWSPSPLLGQRDPNVWGTGKVQAKPALNGQGRVA